MLKRYHELVNNLINTPSTAGFISNEAKLTTINQYAHALFGGKISIPNIIVAGTKGKGSTCAVADSVIQTSGLKSCLFSSPHLVTPRERIKINGEPISEKHYCDLYDEMEGLLNKYQLPRPPFFGIHTLMAGLLIKHKEADVGVIECGIGGRFDWTKIFEPTIAAITHLEYDHLETLGNTPSSISWHKFGIYTDRSINLTVPQNPDFQKAIELLTKRSKFEVKTVRPFWNEKMGLRGPCAQENTALGVAAARELLNHINDKKIGQNYALKFDLRKGAANARIHGRFQTCTKNGIQWLLDGAHTAESVGYCKQWYDSLDHNSEDDILLCATTKKRDPSILLAPLLDRKWKKIIFVKCYNSFADIKNATILTSLEESLNLAQNVQPKSILVTGSLHLVGDVMGELGYGPQ